MKIFESNMDKSGFGPVYEAQVSRWEMEVRYKDGTETKVDGYATTPKKAIADAQEYHESEVAMLCRFGSEYGHKEIDSVGSVDVSPAKVRFQEFELNNRGFYRPCGLMKLRNKKKTSIVGPGNAHDNA